MFKLNPNTSFWAKVPLSVPGADKPVSIEIEFKHQTKSALKKYLESLEGKDDSAALLEIVLNWKGVDADFTRENFSELLDNYGNAAQEIFKAYQREVVEAKTKN